MARKRAKATLAFFFTALASLMMLTGSLVPHHHHGAAVCIDISHCLGHGATVPGGDCHGHDGATPAHTDVESHCVLNLNYYHHQDEKEAQCVVPGFVPGEHSVPVCFVPPVVFRLPEPLYRGEDRVFAAIGGWSHQDFIARASGLRAPPFLIA